jgi:hypothetical protein
VHVDRKPKLRRLGRTGPRAVDFGAREIGIPTESCRMIVAI